MKAMKRALWTSCGGLRWCWLRYSSLQRSFRASPGDLYQQFAMTIAISVMLSAFNALTLSPALAGLLLRPKPEEGTYKRRGTSRKFFDVFNRYWDRSYEWFCPLVARGNSQGARSCWCCWQALAWARFFFGSRLPSSLYAG